MLANSTKVKINSCRVCLETKFTDGVSFDDGDGLLKMYEFCFGLTVSPQDLPRQLCGNCVKKLEDFSKLKLQSHKSDRLWKSIISTRLSCHVKKNKKNIKEDSSDFDYNESIDHYDYNVDEQVNPVIINDVKNEPIEEELEQKIGENLYINIEEELVEHAEDSECDKKPYECNHCNAVFKFEKNYTKHSCSVTKLKAQPDFFCGLCEMKSFSIEEIKEHLDVHSSNNDLSCKLCEFNGRDFADMVSHRYSHQPKKQCMLRCHSCNTKTVTILALQFHYRSVHLKKKGGLCTVCNKEYRCYNPWRNHERWHKTEGFSCDHCGKRFLFKNQIREHLEEHSDYKGFVCDICGKAFKRKSNLLLHIGHVHDDNRVSCSHCNKTFKNKATLKDHLRREDRVKPIECKVCSKRYSSKRSLEVHMIWHTDERPFVCHLCGSAYKAKSQLRIHLRKHTGDMPYKCTQCTRAFPSSNQLKVHLNVHSGVRPYKCPYCEKTFHNKKNVVDHCSKRHNVFDVVIGRARKAATKKESAVTDTAVP